MPRSAAEDQIITDVIHKQLANAHIIELSRRQKFWIWLRWNTPLWMHIKLFGLAPNGGHYGQRRNDWKNTRS